MKKIFHLILIAQFLFSSDLYKEIRIYNNDIKNISFLNVIGIDIDHMHKDKNFIQFAINEYDLNKLIVNNIGYEVIHDDLEEFYASRLDNNYFDRDLELGSMGGYYTFEELTYHLDELSLLYPEIISEKVSIGLTLEGRNIWAIKISDNYLEDENEPEVLYTGLHHAREPMSYMNLFYFMHWIGENYQSDDLATHIVNNRELWFIPAINPDGLVYNQSIAPNGGGMQRKNARQTCNGTPTGVDLNRNYSYMWGLDNEGSSPDGCSETYRGTSPFSEPETQAVANFVEQHTFPLAMNYHSYSNLLIYPFGYEYENNAPQEDVDIMVEYGEDMVQYNNYVLGTGPDLLYPVNGEACDWMYGVHDIIAYTPEIGSQNDGFWPSTTRILPLAEENLYPNQFIAINVGSRYDVEANVESDIFSSGESYPLNINIMNKGLGESNGNVYVNILSSDNLFFELDFIELDSFDAREIVDLGNITYFQISPSLNGVSIEDIVVQVYDGDNFIYEESLQIIVGETELFVFEDFESNNNWVVGAQDDDATAGVWNRLIPIGTYENGSIVQPDSDFSLNGSYCYLTANPTDINAGPGSNDVDGGKTTLLSPIFDLSEYDGGIVSYWKWYTNNQGNNPGSDLWQVDVTFNGGLNWISLESSNITNTFWDKKQFILNDYSLEMSNQVQFRFIAEDTYYDGDNGTGGSLVEAAIDDFKLEVFTTNNSNSLLGDINSDNTLDVIDVVLLVNYIIGQSEFNDYELFIGDLNSDSIINVLDIVSLVNEILN